MRIPPALSVGLDFVFWMALAIPVIIVWRMYKIKAAPAQEKQISSMEYLVFGIAVIFIVSWIPNLSISSLFKKK